MPHRCEVCDEVFNKSNHSQVNCPFCEYESCTDCNERYLLETSQDAHCMACRKGWTRETLSNNFTQKFVTKKYKERRENLLLEREKSMMPDTQVYVELEKKVRKLGKEIAAIRLKHNEEVQKTYKIRDQPLGPLAVANNLTTEFEALILRHKLGQECRKSINMILIDIETHEWHQHELIARIHGGRAADIEKRAFVRACPYADCRGFLSTAWKCGLCENWACPDCHEVKGLEKDTPHTCNPDSVATAQMLARDSRHCPNCASMIFKINGCDQMWCTQCHTAFSWRTGRIETHTIHNPHYYEYRRTHGGMPRQAGDVPCGGLPEWGSISRYLSAPHGSALQVIVTNAYRSHGHGQYIVLPRYVEEDRRNENRDLRIKLMIGDIDEDEFKKKIQQREKAKLRKQDIRQVLQMYLTVLIDLFQSFQTNRNTDELFESLNGLRNHYNTTLKKIQVVYKCAIPELLDTFNFRN